MGRTAHIYPGMGDISDRCGDKPAPYLRNVAYPVVVRAPYEGVDEAYQAVDPLLSNQDGLAFFLFMDLEDSLDDQGPGRVGWDHPAEAQTLAAAQLKADALWDAAPYTGQSTSNVIQGMVADAQELLDEIEFLYQHYRTNLYYVTPDDGIYRGPLSLRYNDFWYRLDHDIHREMVAGAVGVEEQIRIDDRQFIRESWDHALSLLWCASIALAQAQVELKNRDIYLQHKEDRTGTLATAPQTGYSASAQTAQTATLGTLQTSSLRSTRSNEESGSKGSGLFLLAATVGVAFLLSRGK